MATSEKNLQKQGDAQKMREVVASYFGADSRVPGSRVCVNIPCGSTGEAVAVGRCGTDMLCSRCCIAGEEALFAGSVNLSPHFERLRPRKLGFPNASGQVPSSPDGFRD